MPRTPGKNAFAFIFITVLLDMTGLGIIIPVMPKLVMELSGQDVSGAARYGGMLLFLYATMQFFMSPILGNLSDRYGRRPVLLFSLAGYSVDYVIMGLAPTLGWLFLGRAMSGAFAATVSTSNAFIADISPPEKRAQNFGLLGAAFGLGFILGPVIGGLFGHYFGPRAPFFAAAALAFANMVYGYLVLPETLSAENRRPFTLKRANPVGSLTQMRAFPVVMGLAAALFLYQLAHHSLPGTWSYYAIEKFQWTELDIGLSLAFVGLTAAFSQAVLSRKVIPRLGEEKTAFTAMSVTCLTYFGYALITEGWMVYPMIAFGALGGLASPALSGIMSNTVPKDQQGELQGALSSLLAVTMVIGPLMMTQIFAYFTDDGTSFYFPGAAFVTAGALTIVSLFPVARFARQKGTTTAPKKVD